MNLPALLQRVDLTQVFVQKLQDPLFEQKKLQVDVLRLDGIHPLISGNKWFKLKYHLKQAMEQGKRGILSFGGAYSNHLLATASACSSAGMSFVAVVRGERPAVLSPTLLQIRQSGAQLRFVSRELYKNKMALQQSLQGEYEDYYWVNEGGQGEEGIRGASEILSLVDENNYTHILCAVGTGTMMAGLLRSASAGQCVIGIPVIKIEDSNDNDLYRFIKMSGRGNNFRLLYNYHGGGYARYNASLIDFMNDWWSRYKIPSDFVYTAKLFKATQELITTDYFDAGSKLLLIHSGGLQGNRSLEKNQLLF
jgi:D-cysteine desulfhydrase